MSPSSVDSHALRDLAPQGCIRVALNLGNSALVTRDARTGEFSGITVDLAQALAAEVDMPLQLTPFAAAGQVVGAVHADAWDVAFLALDPQRRAQLAFTSPYMLIEGRYLVREAAALYSEADLDCVDLQIAVTAGSTYDLYLSRHLKAAQLCRFTTSQAAFVAFCEQSLPVMAGVTEVLLDCMTRQSGLRLIEPAFMLIEQAMATPLARTHGAQYLADFIARQLTNGFIADALTRHGLASHGMARHVHTQPRATVLG